MNILTGIFYGNYKKNFAAIAETLSNQHQLCRIIDASVDKDGRMHMHSIHHLLDTFHYEPKEKFECEVKMATIKKCPCSKFTFMRGKFVGLVDITITFEEQNIHIYDLKMGFRD